MMASVSYLKLLGVVVRLFLFILLEKKIKLTWLQGSSRLISFFNLILQLLISITLVISSYLYFYDGLCSILLIFVPSQRILLQ